MMIKEVLLQHKIQGKQQGNELLVDCPECGKQKLSINLTTGQWHCFVCNLKGGNIKQFLYKKGVIELMPPVKDSVTYINPLDLAAFASNLKENVDGSLDYLLNVRGLKRPAITQFRLGYSIEEKAIVLPYFNHTGACVGVKYVYLEEGHDPKCRLKKGSKIQAYNLDCIDLTQPLVITEGEFDAISVWQAGWTNVISVPNGAQGMGEWLDEISRGSRYIIATDNDIAGHACAKSLCDKLGYAKCYRAYPVLKDFNDYLQYGLDESLILEAIEKAEPMFTAPVYSIAEYQLRAQEALENPLDLVGYSTGFQSIDDLIKGVRMGEITVFSGITGGGKTSFSLALTNNLVLDQHLKAMIISPEMREDDLLLGLANNFYSQQVTDPAKIKQYCDVIKDRLYVANVYNKWTDKSSILDRTFDMVDYAVNNLGVNFIVIDHLRLFLNSSSADNERHAIDNFMAKCVYTAAVNDVHLWVVVQPRALDGQTRKITEHHLKGSGNIIQDAHNILLIHKEDNGLVEIQVPKCRSRLGLTGTAVLQFDMTSRANYREVN